MCPVRSLSTSDITVNFASNFIQILWRLTFGKCCRRPQRHRSLRLAQYGSLHHHRGAELCPGARDGERSSYPGRRARARPASTFAAPLSDRCRAPKDLPCSPWRSECSPSTRCSSSAHRSGSWARIKARGPASAVGGPRTRIPHPLLSSVAVQPRGLYLVDPVRGGRSCHRLTLLSRAWWSR